MSLGTGPENTSVQAGGSGKVPRTLDAAKKVLREVQPKILELLGKEAFRISLDSLDIMKPEGGDRARAHVMWVGPAEGEGLKKLEEVGSMCLLVSFARRATVLTVARLERGAASAYLQSSSRARSRRPVFWSTKTVLSRYDSRSRHVSTYSVAATDSDLGRRTAPS